MGLIDDIRGGFSRFNAWLEWAGRAAADWAASERGQLILAGLDYFSLSSRIADFYKHSGWYFPVHPAFHRYALEHLEFNAPFDAREAARLIGPGSEHWTWIAEGTLASPAIASRRAVVADAIFCMEHERWHSAISTLLPVIEGIVSDRSGVLKGMRVGERADKLLDEQTGPLEAISAVPALELLDAEIFKSHPFEEATIADDALNRHLVLHGRTAGFGTPLNACRTLMVLLALIELLDGAILFRTDAELDDVSYLDDYGPLAELRIAARRRA